MNTRYSEGYTFSGGIKVYNFGVTQRMKSSKNFPGPSDYSDVNLKHVATKTATYSFAKQPKLQSAKTILPGPGTYSNEKTEVHKNRMPKFSLGKSERSVGTFVTEKGSQFFGTRTSSPGPGYYQSDVSFTKTSARVPYGYLEKSPRGIDFGKENLKTPGPGAYDLDAGKLKNKNPDFTLSKQLRGDPSVIFKIKEELPGPGVYNINNTFGTGPKSLLRGKPKYKADNGVPGPGSYTQKVSDVKKTGGWKMLKSRDDSFLISKGSLLHPGPGVYSSSTIFDQKKKNGFKFGEKTKLCDNNKGNPGPADYAPNYISMGKMASYRKNNTTAH